MEETGVGNEEFQEFRSKEVEWVAYMKRIFEEKKTELWMSDVMGTRVCLLT